MSLNTSEWESLDRKFEEQNKLLSAIIKLLKDQNEYLKSIRWKL